MTEERNDKKTYKWKLRASRSVGRSKIRWIDNVMNDILAMKIVNWQSEHRIEINGAGQNSYSCSA